MDVKSRLSAAMRKYTGSDVEMHSDKCLTVTGMKLLHHCNPTVIICP